MGFEITRLDSIEGGGIYRIATSGRLLEERSTIDSLLEDCMPGQVFSVQYYWLSLFLRNKAISEWEGKLFKRGLVAKLKGLASERQSDGRYFTSIEVTFGVLDLIVDALTQSQFRAWLAEFKQLVPSLNGDALPQEWFDNV